MSGDAGRTILIVAGPTASGKSAFALALAQECGGTIINADSLQLYDGLPLLTAQPDDADKAAIPHRLYGTQPANSACTAAQWREMAVAAITDALAEGRRPIVVGGTGFYLSSLLYGLSDIPEIDPAIRSAGNALQRELGNPAFHGHLAEIDPESAARLNPNDTQRLIRAWEVMRGTGRSLSQWQRAPRRPPPEGWRFAVTVLDPPRADLYRNCDARFDAMMANGAINEVRTFLATGPAASPLHVALGFRPLAAFLRDELPLDDAIRRGKTETRNYAKRQVTWFRHQLGESDDRVRITFAG